MKILSVCGLGIALWLGTVVVGHGAEASLEALTGTWVRPDGGYRLVVESVAGDGTAKVLYFNPAPIQVAEAKAALKDGTATLFVKFDDEGYRGSTYTLALNSDGTRLAGDYFQATQKATYQIYFEKAN